MLLGSAKETREAALNLFQMLRNKLNELASVPISETHNKGLTKEMWSFYAPPQLAVMGARTQEHKASESRSGNWPNSVMRASSLQKSLTRRRRNF
jgi:hypothetical protein